MNDKYFKNIWFKSTCVWLKILKYRMTLSRTRKKMFLTSNSVFNSFGGEHYNDNVYVVTVP